MQTSNISLEMTNKTEMKPLLSIIVPVYNSAEYLDKALDTVIKQDFRDFECILVNDGSTDNSANVCEEYARKDNRIKYYFKTNGGLCSARNYGLNHSSGEYIMFMDNDDEYVEGAFSAVSSAINKYGADVIRFNRKRIQVFDDGTSKADIYGTKGVASIEPCIFDRKTFFANYDKIRRSGCFSGIWNGAFKRKLFDKIRFDESITAGGEDAIVNLEIYRIFDTIVFLPDVLYIYYRRTKHSISTQFQINHIEAIGKEASMERQLVSDNELSEDAFYANAYIYLATLVKALNHKNSTLSYEEKAHTMDSLRENYYGFRYTSSDLKSKKISIMKKTYLLLYTNRKYKLLFLITNTIMKIRGNA